MSFSNVEPIKDDKNLLSIMRENCKKARIESHIELKEDAIDNFLLNVLPQNPSSSQLGSWLASGFKLPLAYPSLHAEVNVLCHLCMLNSLSGYRTAFHNALGQGAHKTIVQIIMSLYIADPAGDSSRPLSAQTLVCLSPMILLDLLGLSTHEEKKHESLPAVVIGVRRRDEIYEALETLCIAANDTGKRLVEMNCPDLGTFVERTIKESAKIGKTDEERASLAANTLIKALPVFNDAYNLQLENGETISVHIHKRAFLLLSWLHSAFLSGDQAKTNFEKLPLPDPAVLPAFVDNVIPSLLVHFGILDIQNAKQKGLQEWYSTLSSSSSNTQNSDSVQAGTTLTREEAYLIRASSVDACHAIMIRGRQLAKEKDRSWLNGITEALIDGFLWTQAKRPDLTIVPRMVEKKTFMY
jgi:Potential Queuosine, Q, salvage protein family